MVSMKTRNCTMTGEEVHRSEENVVIKIPKYLIEDEEGGMRYDNWHITPPFKPTPVEKQAYKPRLAIFEIVNKNFKSYHGITTLGPFDKRFTAIVGPNGSGKSNVIDSMMFVFGYRANKIRSKRLGVLVHNSANFQDIDYCSVEVHFGTIIDNENGVGFREIEGGRLIIGRVAFRDSSSYYTINGKRTTFTAVTSLLKEKGVDLDSNRFLILQGEVEHIALMRSKGKNIHETGLLEYLDDIIGTSRYKEPISDVAAALETAIEETSDEERALETIKKDVQALQKPRDDAIEYIKLENSLFRIQNCMVQKTLYQHNLRYDKVNEEKETIEGQLKSLNEELLLVRNQKSEAENLGKEGARTIAQLYAEKEKLKKSISRAENEDEGLREQMKQTNKRRNEQKTKKKFHEDNLSNLQQIPAKNEIQIKEMSEQICRLEAQRKVEQNKLDVCLSSLQEQTQMLVEQKEVVQTKLINLQQMVANTKSEFDLTKSERQICLRNQTHEETILQSLINQEIETRTNLTDKSKLLMQLKEELNDITSSISSSQVEMKNASDEIPKLTTDMQAKRDKLLEYQANSSSSSGCRELEFLLQKSREGYVSGIFGRLGDLGGINIKYDVAISTACGPLDNILVEDDNVAQECINLLKQYNAGRATFIALNKQQHLWNLIKKPFRSPENVPRLFDLITVTDERVLPAFYYALRDTLVCPNLDQASRIAYGQQRYRVVTLNGQIIETSGTMSGGGTRQSRGRMGQTVAVNTNRGPSALTTAEEAEELKAVIEHIATKISLNTKLKNKLQQEINNKGKEMVDKKDYLKQLAAEVKLLSEYFPRQKQLVEIQKRKANAAKVDPERINMLDRLVIEKENEFKKAKKIASVTEKEVKKITEQIQEITNTRVKSLESKVNSLNDKLKKLKSGVTKLKVGINTSKRDSVKNEQTINLLQIDIQKAGTTILQLEKKMEDLEEFARNKTAKLENVMTQIKEVELKYKGVKGNLARLMKEEHKLRSKRIELKRDEQEVQALFVKISGLVNEQKRKLEKIVLNEEEGNPNIEPLKIFNAEQMNKLSMGTLEEKAQYIQEKLKHLNKNVDAIRKYNVVAEKCKEVQAKYDSLVDRRDDLQTLKEYWRLRRIDEFMLGFTVISLHLKEAFQCLSLGGDADLDLEDPTDPYTLGINFNITPRNKTPKKIQNLSGGEKTLSSLSLILALHNYRPSPIYVMDEIDAALDYQNVCIVGHFIRDRTRNTQFIVISLRANMFELSNRLVGIYKQEDCTQSVIVNNSLKASLKLREMQERSERLSQERMSGMMEYQLQKQQQDEQQRLLTPSPSRNSDALHFIFEETHCRTLTERRSAQNLSKKRILEVNNSTNITSDNEPNTKTSSADRNKKTVSLSSDVSVNDVSINSSKINDLEHTLNTKIFNCHNNSEPVDTTQFKHYKHLNTTNLKRKKRRKIIIPNSTKSNPFVLFKPEDRRNVERYYEENVNSPSESYRQQLKRRLRGSLINLSDIENRPTSSTVFGTDVSLRSYEDQRHIISTSSYALRTSSPLYALNNNAGIILKEYEQNANKRRRLDTQENQTAFNDNDRNLPHSRLQTLPTRRSPRKNYNITKINKVIDKLKSNIAKQVGNNPKRNNRQVYKILFSKPNPKPTTGRKRRKNKRKPYIQQIKKTERSDNNCYIKLIREDAKIQQYILSHQRIKTI